MLTDQLSRKPPPPHLSAQCHPIAHWPINRPPPTVRNEPPNKRPPSLKRQKDADTGLCEYKFQFYTMSYRRPRGVVVRMPASYADDPGSSHPSGVFHALWCRSTVKWTSKFRKYKKGPKPTGEKCQISAHLPGGPNGGQPIAQGGRLKWGGLPQRVTCPTPPFPIAFVPSSFRVRCFTY